MESPVFSWLKALPAIRNSLAQSVNHGLITMREALRAHSAQGFELELLGRLLRTLPAKDVSALPKYRVGVLASYTSEPVANAVSIALMREGYFPEIYEAPYGSYQQEILDPGSALYAFQPDAVVVAVAPAVSHSLPQASLSNHEVEEALAKAVDSWLGLWDVLASRLGRPVIQHLCEIPEQELLSIAERRSGWTSYRYTDSLNVRLIEAAPEFVRWLDVDRLAARVGRQNWRDPRLYHHAKFGFSTRFLPEYTELLAGAMRGALGKAKKALILDLDNTLWGGVIGDDRLDGIQLGPDTAEGAAYESFCRYVKDLGRRGIILGICSKNELTIATEVFEKHPHMPLKLEDFAIVTCNWNDKATNLAQIARDLNIDVSSVVFVDDNPAECELIR